MHAATRFTQGLRQRSVFRHVRQVVFFGRYASSATHLPLIELKEVLDLEIVGQDDAKEALLLGLIAREHVYIEGPPGVGKTLLAESAADAAGLSSFAYQFHRDTRVSELVGDATIVRETLPEGEVIRQGVRPGGILKADVCVLDDISRAPGEALNVLLRILNERSFMGEGLRLRSAIATGNPTNAEFVNEQLDPAVIDRFTLQVDTAGLVKGSDWNAAAEVIERNLGRSGTQQAAAILGKQAWLDCDVMLQKVEFSRELMSTLLAVLEVLVAEFNLGGAHPALLTDRTFLVKAPRVMQARALLHGRSVCIDEDLQVLRLLTRFRVPEHVHNQILDIIEKVLQSRRGKGDSSSGNSGNSEESGKSKSSEQSESSKSQCPLGSEETPENQTSRLDNIGLKTDPDSEQLKESQTQTSEGPGDQGGTDGVGSTPVRPPELPMKESKGDHRILAGRLRVDGAEVLLRSLEGQVQRGMAQRMESPGGVPRKWQTLKHFEDVGDADLADFALWCKFPGPTLPRAASRERVERGGAVAIIRDVSNSMNRPDYEYLLARCASSIVCGILDLARRVGIRVGYSEFGDHSKKFFSKRGAKQFFSRDYERIQYLASNLATRGATNYKHALQHILEEFDNFAQGTRHCMHAVLISDGEPSAGCGKFEAERAWAERLGVCIHTVFIGDQPYPGALTTLALSTGGERFQAFPDFDNGHIRLCDLRSLPMTISDVQEMAWYASRRRQNSEAT